jgi:recombination protein RecA
MARKKSKPEKNSSGNFTPEQIVEMARKRFPEVNMVTLANTGAIVKAEVISTGSLALNKALGIGGFPRGRIVEIFGPESSGKTTIC